MKNFTFGVAFTLLAIVLLAAKTNQSINWQDELKRPEAQGAIADYIQKSCEAQLWENDVKDVQSRHNTPTNLRLHCWQFVTTQQGR